MFLTSSDWPSATIHGLTDCFWLGPLLLYRSCFPMFNINNMFNDINSPTTTRSHCSFLWTAEPTLLCPKRLEPP